MIVVTTNRKYVFNHHSINILHKVKYILLSCFKVRKTILYPNSECMYLSISTSYSIPFIIFFNVTFD